MADQYNEGDIADGPGGQSLVYRGGQWVPLANPVMGGPMVLGTPSAKAPYVGPQAQADLVRAQTEGDLARATMGSTIRQKAADATKAEAEAQVARTTAAQGGQGKNVSPDVRKDAIKQYISAQGLAKQIDEAQRLFDAGPGATHGLAGLRDFLPLEANERLNTAGDRLRGGVINAYGFTSGQSNTPGEVKMNIGGFIPSSKDRYDSVTRDKFTDLRRLQQEAMEKAVGILGGVPDAQGNITRPSDRAALPGAPNVTNPPGNSTPSDDGTPGLPPSGKPMLSLATGATRNEPNPELAAKIEQMVKAGSSAAEINASLPPNSSPISQDAVTKMQAYLVDHPDYSGFASASKTVDNSLRNRLSATPMGAFFASAGDAVVPAGLTGTKDNLEALKSAYPGASLAGTVIGGVPAAGAFELGAGRLIPGAGRGIARLADAAYGAYQGGGNADDGNGLAGAAVGAVGGLAGGEVGRRGIAAAGRVLGGAASDAVRYLRGQGVRDLTVGQAIGGTAKQIEDQATGYPLIGGVIRARRGEGLDQFNRAAFDQATAPLAGQSTPLNATTPNIGPEGVEQLRAIRGAGYSNAVAGRSAVNDPRFDNDYASSLTASGAIPNTGPTVRNEIEAIVPDYFSNGNATGTITGENARAAISELRGLRSARQSDPLGSRTGNAIRSVEGGLQSLFERQSPGFTADLAAANATNGNLKTIEKAVEAAKNTDGVFMPSQLNTASVMSGRNFGGTGATTGRPFYELANAGQEVLPSRVGDSGTAGRVALGTALAATGLGGGYAGYGDGESGGLNFAEGAGGSLAGLAGLAGLASVGGSRGAQRALVSALVDRPDLLRRLGAQAVNRAGIGGVLAAAPGAQIASTISGY